MGSTNTTADKRMHKGLKAELCRSRALLEKRKQQLRIRKKELNWKLALCEREGIIERIGITGVIKDMYIEKTKVDLQLPTLNSLKRDLWKMRSKLSHQTTTLSGVMETLKIANSKSDLDLLHSIVMEMGDARSLTHKSTSPRNNYRRHQQQHS